MQYIYFVSFLKDVHDFSYWVIYHDGNKEFTKNNLPNPIARFAEKGEAALRYPVGTHGMARWKTKRVQFPRIGKLGDMVDFKDSHPACLHSTNNRIAIIWGVHSHYCHSISSIHPHSDPDRCAGPPHRGPDPTHGQAGRCHKHQWGGGEC